ncbi:MAG: M28 family peptidase [Gemmatimonadetes bacterium]|nr:M28 family peptidase [Gemmatimonadota bacterium]
MKSINRVFAAGGLLALGTTAAHAQTITGFFPDSHARQLVCEARLQELPTAQTFREHLRTITAEPHVAGSEANARVAEYLAGVMERAGWEVERAAYDVYMPDITADIDVGLVTPLRMPLNNQENILAEDRFSDNPTLLPGWNAYSGSGNVTAEVVYANYGRREDFDRLQELGVEIEGKIVIARYGENFRGFKAKFAEANGAAGLIMYSDPANGGYGSGLMYPEGRFMNESTIQRGSVLTLAYSGDPLTPFVPALPVDGDEQVERLDPADVAFHTIPVAPIPWGSAQEILSRMAGASVPSGWQGGLPFRYRVTGGVGLTVRLRVNQPLGLKRATNIVGTIRGTEFPDEWIVLGSHYDAWGYGATDPNGGTAMLLTLAEALGQMKDTGCAPRRTIKIAHWDAEEYGLIASVEWVEQYRDQLMSNAVAYINADGAVTGSNFSSSASPSLRGAIAAATKSVMYPGSDETVYDHWTRGTSDADSPNFGNLGGGSDHVGFYTHAGVPSAGLSMSGQSPLYHSNYDTFSWYERFGDTEFVFGPTLARVDGVLAMRLANADILPYDVVRYATDTKDHVATLERLADSLGLAIDLQRLKDAITGLEDVATEFVAARDTRTQTGGLTPDAARTSSAQLIALERAFLYMDGLQGRPWSRSLYASPDPFSGYASWMLPGLRYEIETESTQGVSTWEAIYIQAIEDLTERIRAATRTLHD